MGSADQYRRRQAEPRHHSLYQDGPHSVCPFLRKLETSLNSLGDIHVLSRSVGALEMLKGMLKSNSVLAVTSNTDLIRKIGVFNVVSKKVVDCTVGVDMSEGISIIGQSLIDKATKANKNLA
ncbi:hypothetical protein BGZ92_011458 [Podila epicladia]|nr:hypothetical protein BGZ92_011458 [Podila epicladia]